jgi:ATP-dependent DNA ligase
MTNKYPDVLSIIEAVANVPGKNDKVAILEANKDNEDLKRAIHLALNGLISFYIKKLPVVTEHTGNMTLSDGMFLLKDLSNRVRTGHAAIAFVKTILESVSERDAEVIRRVLGRDLRMGASEGSAEKVWPGLVPSFNVMLATAYSDKALAKIKYPAIAQLKADGSRTQAIVDLDTRTASFWTRNGKPLELSQVSIDAIIATFDGTDWTGKVVLDGEIIYKLPAKEASPFDDVLETKDEPAIADRSTGNGIYNKAVKGTISTAEEAGLHFVLWDLIPYDQWQAGKSANDYQTRLAQLNELKHTVFTSVIETHIVNNLAEATAIYSKYIALDLEGIILKNLKGLWTNTRSKDQVKFKQVMTADLLVIGVKAGKDGKKYAEIAGTLTCTTQCRLVEVDASGMSDAEREWFWLNQDKIVADGMIVEIEYNGIVKSRGSDVSSLFLPQFVKIRDDKTVANTLEELQAKKAEVSL